MSAHRPTYFVGTAVVASLTGLFIIPAMAQGQESAGGIEEIVVFAQKKASGEALQSVPVSITATDAKMIQTEQLQDLTQLGRTAPNALLAPSAFPAYPSFSLRGVGSGTTTRSIDPAVNIFQDGMVIGYPAGALSETFDLESVEILNGPQGVLFGRNSSGGAVVMRTPRPTSDFHESAEVELGNANTLVFKGAVGGPLIGDQVLGKIAIMSNNNTGLWQNTTAGTFLPSPENPSGTSPQHATGGVGQLHEIIVKPTLVFNPSDSVHFTLFGQYQNENNGGGILYAVPDPPGEPVSNLTKLFGFIPSTQPYTVNLSTPGYNNIQAEHVIGELVLDNVVGGQLTTIAAFRHVIYDSTQNSDGTPFNLVIFPDNREKNHQYSLESRYNRDITSQISLLAGVYFYSSNSTVLEKRAINGILAGSTFANTLDEIANWTQEDKTAAVFGNIDYKPTPEITLSAGARYDYEKKNFDIIPLAPCSGANFSGCPTTFDNNSHDWSAATPRFVASYQFQPENLIYASVSQGFRSGNYNGRAPNAIAAITPANPEKVTSYEIGSKNEFLDNHLRINVDGFYENYTNIQEIAQQMFSNAPAVQNLVNAASAKIWGTDFTASWIIVSAFRLDATIGYAHNHTSPFIGFPTLLPGYGPRLTSNIAGTYSFKVPNLSGSWDLKASYATVSHQIFSGDPLTPNNPGYGILDGSLSYTVGAWRISAFGRNIQNTVYGGLTRSLGYFSYPGQPRTYGINVAVAY